MIRKEVIRHPFPGLWPKGTWGYIGFPSAESRWIWSFTTSGDLEYQPDTQNYVWIWRASGGRLTWPAQACTTWDLQKMIRILSISTLQQGSATPSDPFGLYVPPKFKILPAKFKHRSLPEWRRVSSKSHKTPYPHEWQKKHIQALGDGNAKSILQWLVALWADSSPLRMIFQIPTHGKKNHIQRPKADGNPIF